MYTSDTHECTNASPLHRFLLLRPLFTLKMDANCFSSSSATTTFLSSFSSLAQETTSAVPFPAADLCMACSAIIFKLACWSNAFNCFLSNSNWTGVAKKNSSTSKFLKVSKNLVTDYCCLIMGVNSPDAAMHCSSCCALAIFFSCCIKCCSSCT